MKLKQRPDDFQVEEITSVVPGKTGSFGYYRLEKRSIGTPEAIQAFCKQLKIDHRRVRYGGLKDRHAVTIQYLTIEGGPRQRLRDKQFQLHYLGQVEEPYGPSSFSGNHFSITIRDLEQRDLDQCLRALEEVNASLVGNYFDDQRFGSVGSDRQFIARCLIEGDEEQALKLALSAPYEFDRSVEKKIKMLLREKWGQWNIILPQLARGYMQQIVAYLACHPQDFRSAFPKIPFFLRNMYLSAYQSHLWNRILSRFMVANFSADRLVRVLQKSETIPMPKQLSESEQTALLAQNIPLPSSRIKLAGENPLQPYFEAVLEEEGLQLANLKLKHYKEPFFSKGDRPAFYSPEGLKTEIGWDKHNKGHRKLKLMFKLPRGSYATLLVKRITAVKAWT